MDRTKDLALAAEMALKAKHFAEAFRAAAGTIRRRAEAQGFSQDTNTLAHIFDQKAQLEDELCQRLTDNPIETLVEEGLIFP